MRLLHLALCASLFATGLAAREMDSSYVLPKSLPDWVCQTNSIEKSGRKITSYAIYNPARTHVITLAFVTGYKDKEITQDHFDALVGSFAREGLTEVKDKKPVTLYGLAGAQVIAHGVVEEKELKGKGMILKSGGSELTIITIAIGVDLEDADFGVALSGLGVAAQ